MLCIPPLAVQDSFWEVKSAAEQIFLFSFVENGKEG